MRKAIVVSAFLFATAALAQSIPPTPNGIDIPAGYKDWRVVSVTERTDNNTLRVIVGNDAAIEAMRAGNINPWPDGAILGKIVWNQENHGWRAPTEWSG